MTTLDDLLAPHRDAVEDAYGRVDRAKVRTTVQGLRHSHALGFLAGARYALSHPIILTTVEEMEAPPADERGCRKAPGRTCGQPCAKQSQPSNPPSWCGRT